VAPDGGPVGMQPDDQVRGRRGDPTECVRDYRRSTTHDE
jgi:hypothetical protein